MTRAALNEAGIAVDQPVTIPGKTRSVLDLLEAVCKEHELVWKVDHESLVITTKDEDENGLLELRVYDISRALRRGTSEQLMDALTNTAEFGDWEEAGGPAGLYALGNALIVKNSAANQRKIANWLSQIR